MSSKSSQIVIVGAGFAGMWAALSAARKLDLVDGTGGPVEIIVIAPEPTLYIRPRFYEKDVSTASAPLFELFTSVGVRFIQGTVHRIHVEEDKLEYTSANGGASSIHFDRLVLATGSKLFRPASVVGLSSDTLNADQIDSALKLDAHLKSLPSLPDSPARNTVVVCGGGFTGIEIASEMPQRLRGILGEGADIKVIVLERADAIGPDLGPGPRPVIEKALSSLGVTVLIGEAVASVDKEGVTTASGTRIESKTVIWTAGLRASDLTEQIPANRDVLGRLHVTRDLKVVGLDRVFATGDTAHALTDDEGHYALMSCQHAMGLGKSAGNNVVADLLGLPMEQYEQEMYATCLALGPWGAVVTDGWDRKVVMEGAEAHAMKTMINTRLIYPPPPIKSEALSAAEPNKPLVL